MVKIKKSKYMGFCFGVKRAVRLTQDALDRNKEPVYSLGPIIHNPQVIDRLKSKGLRVAGAVGDIKRGIFLIRSHGISPVILKQAARKGLKLIDGTCPFVKRCHTIAKQLKDEGFKIIVVGQKDHPEVTALIEVAGRNKVCVVNSVKAASALNVSKEKIGIIAQTTQSVSDYFDIVNALLKKDFKHIRVFNTVCLDVQKRMQEAVKLAKLSDIIFVVGGKNSANTKRLAKILRAIKKDVYHIEQMQDIKSGWLKDKRINTIGITSGASTPEWIIAGVINRLKNFSPQKRTHRTGVTR